jgi:hypothetical protein
MLLPLLPLLDLPAFDSVNKLDLGYGFVAYGLRVYKGHA